jgi:hypothetical protein
MRQPDSTLSFLPCCLGHSPSAGQPRGRNDDSISPTVFLQRPFLQPTYVSTGKRNTTPTEERNTQSCLLRTHTASCSHAYAQTPACILTPPALIMWRGRMRSPSSLPVLQRNRSCVVQERKSIIYPRSGYLSALLSNPTIVITSDTFLHPADPTSLSSCHGSPQTTLRIVRHHLEATRQNGGGSMAQGSVHPTASF